MVLKVTVVVPVKNHKCDGQFNPPFSIARAWRNTILKSKLRNFSHWVRKKNCLPARHSDFSFLIFGCNKISQILVPHNKKSVFYKNSEGQDKVFQCPCHASTDSTTILTTVGYICVMLHIPDIKKRTTLILKTAKTTNSAKHFLKIDLEFEFVFMLISLIVYTKHF